jgi:ATP-dependent DNA helicase RecG
MPPSAIEFALTLAAGEGQFIEFKESISNSVAREIVAFANAEDGRIYVGVADDKTVKGIALTNKLLSEVQDLLSTRASRSC